MSDPVHEQMLADALMIFMSTPSHRPYELSLSYEVSPELFEVEPQYLVDHPFESPHKYRVGLAVEDHVIFDAFFPDLIHAMSTLVAGVKAKIADESWPDWMGAMEPDWQPVGA